jgi:hypothetical protein
MMPILTALLQADGALRIEQLDVRAAAQRGRRGRQGNEALGPAPEIV